jgi:hypothetical protein
VDEAPVPDAGSTIRAFSSEENASNKKPFSRSVAGADAADVVAVGVELANPADLGSCEWLGMRGNNRDEMPLNKDFRQVFFVNGRD